MSMRYSRQCASLVDLQRSIRLSIDFGLAQAGNDLKTIDPVPTPDDESYKNLSSGSIYTR